MTRPIIHRHSLRMALAASVLLLASACAQPAKDVSGAGEKDPAEGFNRAMFAVHNALDGTVIKPVTIVYRGLVPEPGRDMVDNFLQNLSAPVVSLNSFLQQNPEGGFTAFWRFVLNSTLGIGGLFDVASEAGLKPVGNGFGMTLAYYGSEPGSYLFLPVLGPTNPRDLLGTVADGLMNPFNYYDSGATMARGGATVLNERDKNFKLLEDIYRDSLDPYVTIRSAYTQKRASEVRKLRGEQRKLKAYVPDTAAE